MQSSQQEFKNAIVTTRIKECNCNSNQSQHHTFWLVTNHCFQDSQPLRLCISGGRGTGKHFLVNVIIAYIHHCHAILSGKSPVFVYVPAGTASRNIHGQTVHPLLNILVTTYNEYVPVSAQVLPKLKHDHVINVHHHQQKNEWGNRVMINLSVIVKLQL